MFIDDIRFRDIVLRGPPPATVPEPFAAMPIGGAGLAGAFVNGNCERSGYRTWRA